VKLFYNLKNGAFSLVKIRRPVLKN